MSMCISTSIIISISVSTSGSTSISISIIIICSIRVRSSRSTTVTNSITADTNAICCGRAVGVLQEPAVEGLARHLEIVLRGR